MQISAFLLVQIYHNPFKNHHHSYTQPHSQSSRDFGCDVICKACQEDLPNIALGSKPRASLG